MQIEVVEGDLLDQKVEAIVNPWNRNRIPWWLLLPHGVSGAIKRRAGLEPFRELARMGPLALGDAVATGAGKLPFKQIIHVASIDLFWNSSSSAVQTSTINALKLAEQLGLNSLAFPILGAGSGRLSPQAAEEMMLQTFADMDSSLAVKLVRYRPN
jgi:Predicted phosphatase homologous to the C-terminal domain of histone macroH2A1